MHMKRFSSYLEQLQEQKKVAISHVSFAVFGIPLFLAVAATLVIPTHTVNNNHTIPRSQASNNFNQTSGRPFADHSPWNDPIGTNVQLDPANAEMVSNLASGQHPANLYEFGTPIYNADVTTPRYAIDCTEPWGICDLEQGSVPIPQGAVAAPGSDGQMVVIDWSTRESYEFWQYRNDHARTSWGGVISIDRDGTGSQAVGSGTSRLAGIVRTYEIEQGVIDHALVFSTSFCQGPDNGPNFRYPATKTDGKFMGTGAVPEGARIQLDPSVNVDAIPGITAGERMVAKALQKYGAYNIDCGGAAMAFGFEHPEQKPDPYLGVGFAWDYFDMSHIPWNRIRVLKAWNSYTPVQTPTPTPTPTPPPAGDTQAPTAPSNARVTDVTRGSITIAWNAATDNVGVTQYNIWRGDSSYANWIRVGEVSGVTLRYTITGLQGRTTYTIGVRAQDAAGNISAGSNTVKVTTSR